MIHIVLTLFLAFYARIVDGIQRPFKDKLAHHKPVIFFVSLFNIILSVRSNTHLPIFDYSDLHKVTSHN